MSGYILRGGQENITLPAAAVESLLRRGEGDAALLYLALQRFGRGVTPEELGALLRHSGIPLYGAALRPDALDARQADYSRCALAIGSEGRGLSREVLDLCDKTVLIPMSPRCESLNAAIAAAVLLWESWR